MLAVVFYWLCLGLGVCFFVALVFSGWVEVARHRIGGVFVVLVFVVFVVCLVGLCCVYGVFLNEWCFCCVSGWVEVARQRIGGVFVVLVVLFCGRSPQFEKSEVH